MRRMCAAVLAALIVAGVASAQSCGKASYGYAQHYVQPYVQQYIAAEIVHPYAVAVAVNANQFYSVAPELANARINQEIAEKAADRAVEKFFLKLQALQTGPAPAGAQPLTTNAPTSKMQTIANNKCVSCHNGPQQNGIDLRDVSLLSREQRKEVWFRVTADPEKDKDLIMPKPKGGSKATPLTQEEMNVAHAFVKESPAGPPIPPAKKEEGLRIEPRVEPMDAKK